MRRWPIALSWLLALALGCAPPADEDGSARDAAAPDGGLPEDAASAVDAASVAPPDAHGGGDASVDPIAGWARYTIAPGAHAATLATGSAGNPRGGLVTGIAARDYDLAFDPSAKYVITHPTEPEDQLDWNKLPGLSDCGTIDLAADGAMFGWRWRLDVTPPVLEVTAYANDAGKHLTPEAPMITLDAADLASITPLRYRLRMDGAVYRFDISGKVRGRAIDVSATLPRRCATTAPSTLGIQWAAGFYFGGTSVSPAVITARIFERAP